MTNRFTVQYNFVQLHKCSSKTKYHFLVLLNMFKIPPKSWGQLKQVEKQHYYDLRDVLIPLLPRSRRILESLNACLNNCFDIWDCFYVPEDEEFTNLSGIVVVLINEYSPNSLISFISKEKDADKVLNIIDKCINWNVSFKFGPVADWYIPGIKQLCQKHGNFTIIAECKHFECVNTAKLDNVKSSTSNTTSLLELPTTPRFKAKNGQIMFTKALGPDYANFINDNWKFKSGASFLWIKNQCQSNMAFGTFLSMDSAGAKCSKF